MISLNENSFAQTTQRSREKTSYHFALATAGKTVFTGRHQPIDKSTQAGVFIQRIKFTKWKNIPSFQSNILTIETCAIGRLASGLHMHHCFKLSKARSPFPGLSEPAYFFPRLVELVVLLSSLLLHL